MNIKGVKKMLVSLALLAALAMPVVLDASPAQAITQSAPSVSHPTLLPFQACSRWQNSVVSTAKARGDKIVKSTCYWNVRKGYKGWRGEVVTKSYTWKTKGWRTLYYARDFSK